MEMKRTFGRLMAFLCALWGLTAAFAADVPEFPQKWTVFLFDGRDCNPSAEELKTIPAKLNGISPIERSLVNHTFDFASYFKKPGETNNVWLFAKLDAPKDMDYQMGCGADWWFDCYLNGKKVDGTFPAGNVLHPPRYTDHLFVLTLKKGTNVIAVKFRPGDASSVIAMGGDKELASSAAKAQQQARIALYEKRGVALEVENVVPKDLKEKIARGLAPAGYEYIDSYWAKLLRPPVDVLIDRASKGATLGSARILSCDFKGDTLVAKLTGKPALTPEDVFYAFITAPKGQTLFYECKSLKELDAKFGSDGVVTVTIPELKDFHYGASATGTVTAGLTRRNLTEKFTAPVELGGEVYPGEKAVLRVENTEAGPTPMLNGKPFFYTCFTIHPYLPGRTIPTGMEGPNSPVNVVATRVGGNSASRDWWYGPGQYDFTAVDWSINGLIKDFPDSKIALFLWCHPNKWYGEMYPERLALDEDGQPAKDYYVSKVSFSNPDVQKDTLEAMSVLVEHCEKYFSSKIVIYNLMGGTSCEWQGWNSHSTKFSDYSAQTLKDYQDYAAQRGITVDHVPSPEEHKRSDGGTFRNPAKDWNAMLYDRFYSEAIAGFIDKIAGTVKEKCEGDKLVGAYYGYHLEYSNMGYTGNRAGHNDLRRLLNSSNVDFFLSPQSYSVRALGAPNADMKPYGAMRLAGKLSILEDDTRTHKLDQCGFRQALNQEQTLKMLTRNVGMDLCHRMPIGHLGEHGGDEMATPELYDFYAKALEAGQFIMEQNEPDPTQIAVVIDEKAIQYLRARNRTTPYVNSETYEYDDNGKLLLNPNWNILPLTGEAIGFQRYALAHFGAPVDVILLEDVAKTAGKYKMVIFLNSYRDCPELRAAFRALRAKNVAIVSLYGTGFIGDNGFSTKAMSELLGMDVKTAASGSLQLKMADGTILGTDYSMKPRFTVADKNAKQLAVYAQDGIPAVFQKGNTYFYGGACLDEKLIREIARQNGIHIYLETGDNFYAGANVVSIHAKYPGEKTIRLPKKFATIVDAFSGEVVAREADQFTIDMQATDSRVFLLK